MSLGALRTDRRPLLHGEKTAVAAASPTLEQGLIVRFRVQIDLENERGGGPPWLHPPSCGGGEKHLAGDRGATGDARRVPLVEFACGSSVLLYRVRGSFAGRAPVSQGRGGRGYKGLQGHNLLHGRWLAVLTPCLFSTFPKQGLASPIPNTFAWCREVGSGEVSFVG